MGKSITVPEHRVPVARAYEVAVVGGGIAGVAAAVAAARQGAKVCLIEKETALGGLATLGNVVIYLPICDGEGRQVIAGLGEELLLLSIRDGADQVPACWQKDGDVSQRRHHRFRVGFNPAPYMLELEALVVSSGVELWYDTRFCDVVCSGDRIEALLVENKSGRLAIECQTVVDASGDADVCARSGEATESLRTNVESGWFYYYDGGKVLLNTLSKAFPEDPRQPPQDSAGYAGDDGADVTAQVLATRRMLRQEAQRLRRDADGKGVFPLILPLIPSFRMTRRLKGRIEIEESDDRRYFDDAVGMTGNWRKSGPVYFIPYGALIGVRMANLITAGRCISANGAAWDITRVIPTCAVTGEAAGVAAAMGCRQTRGRLRDLDPARLQEELRARGVLIDRAFARS